MQTIESIDRCSLSQSKWDVENSASETMKTEYLLWYSTRIWYIIHLHLGLGFDEIQYVSIGWDSAKRVEHEMVKSKFGLAHEKSSLVSTLNFDFSFLEIHIKLTLLISFELSHFSAQNFETNPSLKNKFWMSHPFKVYNTNPTYKCQIVSIQRSKFRD